MPLPQQGDFNQEPVVEAWFSTKGGVYSSVNPHLLGEEQCAYAKNADWDEFGARKRRQGVVPLGTPSSDSAYGFGSWVVESNLNRYLVGVWGERSYWSNGNREWEQMPGTTVTTWSLPSPGLYDIVQGYANVTSAAEGALFFCSIIPYTNSTYPDLGIVPDTWGNATINASYAPRAIRWWQGRLWLATDRNYLRWSNILDGATIGTSNYIEVGPYDGDDITAIVPTRSEAPRLYVFKQDHIFALDVVWDGGVYIPSTENTLDTTNSNLIAISERVGCVAPKTIVYASGSKNTDIFFLARDGYRSLIRVEQDQAGGAGLPISEPIRDIMDRINWPHVVKAHASVYDHKIYLALPLDGATECTTTVVYDLIHKRWIGEYSWATKDSTQFAFAGYQSRLYFQWQANTGETYTADTYTGYTDGLHVFEVDTRQAGGFSLLYRDPDGALVEYQEVTRGFVFGDYGRKKQWNWIEMVFGTVVTTATYTLDIRIDDGAWSTMTVGTIEGGTTIRRAQHGLMGWPVGNRLQFRYKCDGDLTVDPQSTRVAAWVYDKEDWL